MLKSEQEHRILETNFLNYLGKDTMFVLKGATALMLCYGLDRMSEDLDFDALSTNSSMIKKVDGFCKNTIMTMSSKRIQKQCKDATST